MMRPYASGSRRWRSSTHCYGYPALHDMLRASGQVMNHKRTYRTYREEGLQVRTKRRNKLARPRVPIPVPDKVNQRWSMDFVSDQLASGRHFRVLNVACRVRTRSGLICSDSHIKRGSLPGVRSRILPKIAR